ncbi:MULTISPECIES: YbgA family protein [Photobacterium]|uniref:Membrane protein n=1 Tax=Photobacterium halotolerans TaxID=265726 RepID=A0A0F5VDQ0_9GAMM|nr:MULTISPECIES: 2-thiouracil desulfurase family protein [Photobacterium]KKC99604.1 membrane protein [Photobacterium halotolerans]UIP29890.1 2-thiouracil desulfurase family protein [Photobacterium sp. TLY01]
MSIPVGISACVLGEKVRFDGGHKRNRFVTDELAKFVQFRPVCPEMAIGLPVPRPTIRLVQQDNGERLVDSKGGELDFTDKMKSFADQHISAIQSLCGFVVCAKSPTCGMERVKLYIPNGNTVPGGTVGVFTKQLMAAMPWLPVEEDGRLQDPVLRENFVFRIYALHDFYQNVGNSLTLDAFVKFHSRYKFVLMAHSPTAYREMGRLVAGIKDWDLAEFFVEYRQQFMHALSKHARRSNNTNVLMHLQGYFKRNLTREQKQELLDLIESYRLGHQPILVPLALIKHYLKEYPDPYLQLQTFLNPYPEELKLRYGL